MNRDFQSLIKRTLREYAETLFLALVLALLLRLFVVAAYRVSNPTMVPNLKVGDFIVGWKLPYGFEIPFTEKKVGRPQPKRNQVLIFKCPFDTSKSCIKRVVALPGDRVQILKKKLLINGRVSTYEALPKGQLSQATVDLISPPKEAALLVEKSGAARRKILITSDELDEKYGPLIVPPGHFFVLSDFRDQKEDSREWGVVPFDLIEARALFVWFSIDWSPSLNNDAPRIRWNRILDVVR